MCESFFSTLAAELLSRRRFASQAETRMACFSYIDGWCNPVRYQPPVRRQRQRVAIAQALAQRATVLLADEPICQRQTPTPSSAGSAPWRSRTGWLS